MFTDIVLIDYQRPLAERAKSRKVVGPYHWRPSDPMSGRGFYQSSKRLACDPRGASFDLRLELANDHLNDHGYGSLARVNGYYTDDFCDETMVPIVARLPHGRGFMAGWTMGKSMCATLAPEIYPTIEDAARAAHSEAEHDAERERDYQAQQPSED